MTTTVGVAGITGRIGHLIGQSLVAHPHVKVRGYGRDEKRLHSDLQGNVEFTTGQADDWKALRTFVRGCDVIVCTYWGDHDLMIDGQKRLIDLCEDEKVPRYITSDFTLNHQALTLGEFPLKDAQIEICAYLKSKENVQGVHILNGWFMELVWSRHAFWWDAETKTANYWGEGDEVWESTTLLNIADYTAAVALDREAIGFQSFLGDRKSFRDIVTTMESVYDIKIKSQRQGSLDDLCDKMKAQNYHPVLAGMYFMLNRQCKLPETLDNHKYPQVKPVTYEKFLQNTRLEDLHMLAG